MGVSCGHQLCLIPFLFFTQDGWNSPSLQRCSTRCQLALLICTLCISIGFRMIVSGSSCAVHDFLLVPSSFWYTLNQPRGCCGACVYLHVCARVGALSGNPHAAESEAHGCGCMRTRLRAPIPSSSAQESQEVSSQIPSNGMLKCMLM